MQVLTRLGESSVRDLSNQVETAADRGEEAVEHRLLRLVAHPHQRTDISAPIDAGSASLRLRVNDLGWSGWRASCANSSEAIRAKSFSVKYCMKAQ
jgi:hypothetical protein